MDMKYDSAVMHRLVEATEQRMAEAYNCLERALSSSHTISTSDWDDAKRKEFESIMAEIRTTVLSSVQNLKEYLDHLKEKMVEFENRG